MGKAAPEHHLLGFVWDPGTTPISLLGAEQYTPSALQKDPENLDYEDLFLYSNALTEEVTSPAHVPREHQNPSSSYPRAAPEKVCDRKLASPTQGWGRGRSGQQLTFSRVKN